MTRFRFAALLVTVLSLTIACRAFDTGPHFDLIRDALAAEGFGNTASQVAQVAGWMTDLYAGANPQSVAAPWLRERVTAALAAQEKWPAAVTSAAARLHFDGVTIVTLKGETKKLENGEAVALEWDRFIRAAQAAAIDRANADDPRGLLIVLGISAQAVQDFYAHTNWVEPAGDAAKDGFDGPGWAAKQIYGSHPTYFDVPPGVRSVARVYAGIGAPLREEGFWNSDGNRNLATALNKDWPGRPLYRDAYLTACFATRQWVQAMRLWVNNEPVWHLAQLYADRHGEELDRDLAGIFKISAHAGHWQGQGEPKGSGHEGPGGSANKLSAVLEDYRKAGKTAFRTAFEAIVPALAAQNPPPGDTTVLFSWAMQADTDFAVLKIAHLRDTTGKADLYARATIAGQPFISPILHGDDAYTPIVPITFIKALPVNWKINEPVTTLRVEVATGDAKDAGTDDNVSLRVNDNLSFKLERPKFNGFEKGSRDTYALVPPSDLLLRDIRYLQLEKAPDGKNGNWQLKGVKVEINGQQAYARDGLKVMLEGEVRAWRAPGFTPRGSTVTDVPVMLALYADGGGLSGKDVLRDINPDYNRSDLMLLLDRTAPRFRGDLNGEGKGDVEGGARYGGKGTDPGKAQLAFAIERARPTPASVKTAKISATLAADPATYSGKLPAIVIFNGAITVDQPCDVTYRFVRSDGAIMLTKILHFDDAGTKNVQDNWQLNKAATGWMMLKVEAPLTTESGKAPFDVKPASATSPTNITPPSNTGATPPPTNTGATTPPSNNGTTPPPTIAGNLPVTLKGITVSLNADSARYTGTLPVTVTFKGAITVDRAMDVKFRLVRSDGMMAPPQVVHFGAAGTKEIKDTWLQRKAGAGWMTLRIDEPVKLESSKAQFEISPGGDTPPSTGDPPVNTGTKIPPGNTGTTTPPGNTGTVTPPTNTGPPKAITAALSARPERYLWRLPAIIAFSGAITVDQPCDVTYRFVRSDGAITPVRTITLKTAGAQQIQDVWMFKQPFSGWMQLVIEAPLTAQSNQATFEIAPTDAPPPDFTTAPPPVTPPVTPPAAVKVTATLAADPAKYTGKYPAMIAFKGAITVDGPGEVKYRFTRGDGAILPAQTLRFDAAGTKEVQEFWVHAKPYAGWVVLDIIAPVAVSSQKAAFEVGPESGAAAPPANTGATTPPANTGTTTLPPVTPTPTAKVAATLTAEPARYTGAFPAIITFNAAITVDAPGDVTYRFVRSDGAITPTRTITFKAAGTQQFKDVWAYKQPFSGWLQLKIEAPAAVESNQAPFEVAPGG